MHRRSAILKAAISLVLRSGMGAVSHRVVAAEAGVPLGATRYYFGGREELLLACVNDLDVARSRAADDAIHQVAGDARAVGQLGMSPLLTIPGLTRWNGDYSATTPCLHR